MNQGTSPNTNQAALNGTPQNNYQNLSASQRGVQTRMNSSQKVDIFNQNTIQAQSHQNDQETRNLNSQLNNLPLLDIFQQIDNHNQNLGQSQEILINDTTAQIDANFNRSNTFYQSGSSLQNSNLNMNYNDSNRNNAQNNCLRVNTYNMNLRAMDGNSSDTYDEDYRNQYQTRQIKWASGAGPLESDEEGNEEDQISQSELQGVHNSNDSSSQSSPPLTSYHQAGQQIQNRRNVLGRITANQNELNSSDEEDDISNTTSQDDNQTASQTSNSLRNRLNDQENQNLNIQSLVARQANNNGIQLIQTTSNNRQNLFNRIISQQNQQIGILSQLNNRRNIVEQDNRGEDLDPTSSYPTIIDIDENDDVVSMSDSLNIINTTSINNIQSQVGTIIRANHSNTNSRFNQGAELAAELISNAYRQSQQNPNQPLTRQQREEQKQMANQNIDEIFKCFICFGKIQDAVLCPSCSKLCCRDCIRKWLTEQRQQCPHCRAHLQVHQLVNCRFVEEITAAFETLNQPMPDSQRNATLEDGTMLRDGVEICKQHGARLDYYCQTCKIPICSECAMFGGEKHKDHKFLRLAEVYEKHCDVIKKEAECLKKRLKELTKHMNDVKSSIEKVTKAKEDKCKEIENFVENIQHKLNTKLKNKLLTLLNQKQTMQDEIEQLDEFHNKLNQELTKMPKTALIKKSGDLIRQLKEIHTKEPHRFVDHEVSIDFSSDLVPEYEQSLFQIKNFSRIRQNNQAQILTDENEIVYSDPPLVTKSGLTWRLKVYPNGNGIAKGNYISVFLEMLKGLPDQNTQKYEYRVEMINHRTPSAQVVREFASEFEVGECWGYNRFYRIDLLDREGYLNQEDDSITLKFFVRAPCYAQHCQDQERHIFSLQKQIENQQKEMDLVKEKFYQMQKKYKKQQNQKLAAQKLIQNSAQQLNSQQDDIDHNKLSNEEVSSLHDENNVELDVMEIGQNLLQKKQSDQNQIQFKQEIIQGEDQNSSQKFIKELKEKQKRNDQKLAQNQNFIQMAIQSQITQKQNNQKLQNQNEIIVRNPFDDDKEENKTANEDQTKLNKKQSRQTLKNQFFGQQNELNQSQSFQLQVCKNTYSQNNIKQINEQFRSNNPAMKIINPKSQQQTINEKMEESKNQNNYSSQLQDQNQKFGMNILLNQFKQGMKQEDDMQIIKKKKIEKNSHYEKILGQNQNIIQGIDENDKSSSDCDQNINQKLKFNENQSIFHSENIIKKQQHLKHAKTQFEEKEYDQIIQKNKKEQKKLEKDIKNLNRSEREMNCSNNSNSSLSQNEEELREKEQYRLLKESLKNLQERANQNLKINNQEILKINQSISSNEEDNKLQINPYLAKSSIENSHLNFDDGNSASENENNAQDQDCFNIASILKSGKSPLQNQHSQMINENIFGSPQNQWLKNEKQNIKGNNEKISDEKLNNLRKVGTGLVDQNNEFETDLILSSPEYNIDGNIEDQSYIQSSINASENIQSNQEIKNEQLFQQTKIKISQFSKDPNYQTVQYDESQIQNQLNIESILSINKEIKKNEKEQKIIKKQNQLYQEEEKQFENNDIQNQIQFMNNTQKIQQIRKLAQKHDIKEQKLLNRIQNLHQEKMTQQKESEQKNEIQANILINSQILKQSNSSFINNGHHQLPPQSQKSSNIDKERKKQTLQLLSNYNQHKQENIQQIEKDQGVIQSNKIQNLKRITSSVTKQETPQKKSNSLNTSIEQNDQTSTRGQSQTNIIVAGTITSNQKLLAGLNQLKQKRMLKQNNLSSPNSLNQFNPSAVNHQNIDQ